MNFPTYEERDTCLCGDPLVMVWFDRSICPQPCDLMHERCDTCGRAVGYCPFEGIDEHQLMLW